MYCKINLKSFLSITRSEEAALFTLKSNDFSIDDENKIYGTEEQKPWKLGGRLKSLASTSAK